MTQDEEAAVDLLVQLNADVRDQDKFKFSLYGINSGYPLCCIAFFINLWQRIGSIFPDDRKKFEQFLDSDDDTVVQVIDAYFDYLDWVEVRCPGGGCIPCPACVLAGKRVLGNDWRISEEELEARHVSVLKELNLTPIL